MVPLLLAAQVAAAGPAPASLERLLDAQRHPVATVARIERSEDGVRRSLWLVRGLLKDDLVVAQRQELSSRGTPIHLLWLADRAALRLERLPDGRLSVREGSRSLRWFEDDAQTPTVRCGLLRVTEALDGGLVPAAEQYGALKQALGEASWSELELPLRLLRALAPARPPLAATHRRVPIGDEDPEAEALRRDVETAYARALRTP